MAKRKKSKTRDKSKDKHGDKAKVEKLAKKSTPDGFWHQAGSIVLFLIALLAIFGSFGGGGPLAVNLFEGMRWLIGVVAYLLPFILIISALIKIRSETNRMPRAVFWGILILIVAAAGFSHLFIDKALSMQAVEDGQGGGIVGHVTATGILGVLNKVTGGIVLFFLALIAMHFVFRLPLTHFFRLMRLKKAKLGEDALSGTVPIDGVKSGFTLNEGVPIQKGPVKASRAAESGGALTTIGDPGWNFPSLDLLNPTVEKADAGDIDGIAKTIKDTMSDFDIDVEMEAANVGPRVTQYTLRPPNGVKLTKIVALEGNLALNLAATSIRIEAPIPGKKAVGIEVPNHKTATVRLHALLDSPAWKDAKSPLSIAIGKDIAGEPIVADLDRMPHLLVAGATGTGKSVMINSILLSLLYRNSPSDLKLILVDPKQVELTYYDDIPHLLTPVITEHIKCISALKWATAEMDRRYTYLREAGKRDIGGYNALKKEEGMPYIVIVIDELADLMMMAAREVEALVVRLAQKSRAVGIHLVLATQRPSVDVITGLIKANIPARIAFTVVSQVDSRTILDGGGAEKLLGRGDMLMQTSETPKPVRIQGAIAEEAEIKRVNDFLRTERAPQFDDDVVSQQVSIGGGGRFSMMGDENDDLMYQDALQVVVDSGKASTSLLQRRLRIGYARAARLIETLEERGMIGPPDGARPREVLISQVPVMHDSDDALDAADELEVDDE